MTKDTTAGGVEALRVARDYVDDALADAQRDLNAVLNYPTLRAQKQAYVGTIKADLAKIDAALALTPPAKGDGAGTAVPAGWKLVPVDPTVEMLEAAGRYADHCAVHNYGGDPDAEGTWDAMLAAAPSPAGETGNG